MQLNAALVHVRHFIKKTFYQKYYQPQTFDQGVCLHLHERVILNIDKTLIEQRHRKKRA